jgi:hypothetical protein
MKVFSVQEANALLPLTKGILLRLRSVQSRLSRLQPQARLASKGAENGGGGMPGGNIYVQLIEQLVTGSHQLESLGVQIKDYKRGLVDFPSMRDGRIVFLCWQLGEGNEVEWWHDIEAGFAGRQPL